MSDLSRTEPDALRLPSLRVPLAWVLFSLIAGYAVAAQGVPHLPRLFACASLAAAVSAAFVAGPRLWLALLVIALTAFGIAHWQIRNPPEPVAWQSLPVREAEVELIVERTFRSLHQQEQVMGLGRVTAAAHASLQELEGCRVYFTARRCAERLPVERGDRIRLRGIAEYQSAVTDPSGFDAYLTAQGVAAQIRRGAVLEHLGSASRLAAFGNAANARLTRILLAGSEDKDHPYGRVFAAMLLGQKWMLGPELRRDFVHSGTMHLFAVSGLHVAAVALTLALALQILRVPARISAVGGLLLLFGYVLATGAPPSAVRAYSMVAFYWAASAFFRQREPLAALVTSAVVVLLWDPRQIFAVGFQLSYAVVASILLFGLPLAATLRDAINLGRFLPVGLHPAWVSPCATGLRWLAVAFSISLAASLGSMPLIIAYFHLFTPGAVLLNLALIPAASLAVVNGVLSAAVGLLGLEAASAFLNRAAWVVLAAMIAAVEAALRLPGYVFPLEWRTPLLPFLGLAGILGSSVAIRFSPLTRTHTRFALPVFVFAVILIAGTRAIAP